MSRSLTSQRKGRVTQAEGTVVETWISLSLCASYLVLVPPPEPPIPSCPHMSWSDPLKTRVRGLFKSLQWLPSSLQISKVCKTHRPWLPSPMTSTLLLHAPILPQPTLPQPHGPSCCWQTMTPAPGHLHLLFHSLCQGVLPQTPYFHLTVPWTSFKCLPLRGCPCPPV